MAPARATQPDGIGQIVLSLEAALQSGSMDQFRALLAPSGETGRFETLMAGPRNRAVVRERDRMPGDTGAVELLLDTFVERGASGKIATWRATVRPG